MSTKESEDDKNKNLEVDSCEPASGDGGGDSKREEEGKVGCSKEEKGCFSQAIGPSEDNGRDNLPEEQCVSDEVTDQTNREERKDSAQNTESSDTVPSFRRRRFSIGRQYRRRSGAEESSEDEFMPPEPRGSESDYQPGQLELSSSSSDSSCHSSHSMSCLPRSRFMEEDEPTPKVLQKPKPCHKWFAVKEIINRELGSSVKSQSGERFQHRFYGSLHAVERLELMYKLERHRGCVNSLHFSRSGELLVSASDDRKVVLWDWAADRSVLTYDSGHTGNVFQAKFLPLNGDGHIVTCARDGQVRLSVLSSTGVCKGTRLLAQHRRPTHKLAIHCDTPHVFLSAGEDALVLSHDVRTSKASKLLFVKEDTAKISLYSINNNPVNSDEFIVTGEDHFIRLYDKRKISDGLPVKKFCPKHLRKPDAFLHVTSAVFNYNGTEVIGSYNDDDIYLFDTRLPSNADYVHKYEGHRNSITVKGVNFFGPRSEFIVSGSDCGNIYFWDKGTESIVQWMRGDEEGVVNCLEPHPRVPIIATSGLDSDIKIWVPSCEQEPTLKGLKSTIIANQSDRDYTRGRRSDPFDNRQMRWLWRQIHRFEQRRRNTASSPREEEDVSLSQATPQREAADDASSSASDEELPNRPQCSPS